MARMSDDYLRMIAMLNQLQKDYNRMMIERDAWKGVFSKIYATANKEEKDYYKSLLPDAKNGFDDIPF